MVKINLRVSRVLFYTHAHTYSWFYSSAECWKEVLDTTMEISLLNKIIKSLASFHQIQSQAILNLPWNHSPSPNFHTTFSPYPLLPRHCLSLQSFSLCHAHEDHDMYAGGAGQMDILRTGIPLWKCEHWFGYLMHVRPPLIELEYTTNQKVYKGVLISPWWTQVVISPHLPNVGHWEMHFWWWRGVCRGMFT